MKPLNTATILTLLFTLVHSATAAIKLPNILDHNMVIQRGKPARIWGWGEPTEKVTVTFGTQRRTTNTKPDGRWMVELSPMEASFESGQLRVESPNSSIVLTNILVGEVWICGGQSNMEWSLRATRDADMEMASADYPAIRFIRLPHIARLEPQEDFPVESPESSQGNWRHCVTEQVENCTGVGYYFARRLQQQLNVPIGLIDTSWGGTMAQHWITKKTLRSFDEMKPYFEQFETAYNEWTDGGGEDGAKSRYEQDLKTWEIKRAEAKTSGEREPRRPNQNSYADPSHGRHPGGMFDGMIHPLRKLAIRGVLFYQGENNSFNVAWKPFPKTFPAVIADWRKAFGNEALPFGIIQIAGWSTRRSMTYDMNHHASVVREIQFNTWRRTPNTGLIVTFDCNSNGSIHPARKLPVGERSARWALAEVYKVNGWQSNRPLEWRGPVYESMKVEEGKIIITFNEETNRGLRLDKDVDVGFYIAGEDQEFHHARAQVIKGGELRVWNDQVPNPVAVRYGWSNLPVGGLMNGRELPAYPFRTDTWPLTPHQSTGSYLVAP